MIIYIRLIPDWTKIHGCTWDHQFRTYIAPAVHISELVQMRFDSGQVVLLDEREQTLDGQGRHLEGGGGVHGWTLASCSPLEGKGREEKRISLSGAISVPHHYQLLNRSDTRTRCIFPDDTSAHVDKFSISSYVRVCKNALCGELNKFITHDLRRELGSLIQIISVHLLERKTRAKCVCSERSREGS